MTIDQAVRQIQACAEQMNARYKKVVFDEWAVISLGESKGRVLSYIGPRKSGFRENFLADARAFHRGGGVSEQAKAERLFYSTSSRILYAFKHFRRIDAIALLLVPGTKD